MSAWCMAIVNPLFLRRDITKFTFRAYIAYVIGWNLKPGQVVIINLFRRRILLYSSSRQMTFYMFYSKLQNSKCGVNVRMWKNKKLKFTGEGRGVENIRCYKHREIGVGLLCSSTHPNLRTCRGFRNRWDFLNNLRSHYFSLIKPTKRNFTHTHTHTHPYIYILKSV